MRGEKGFWDGVDIPCLFIYFAMVMFGWLNIYAVVYDPENVRSILDVGLNSGKQLFWIGSAVVLITAIFIIEYRFYESTAYVVYAGTMLLLVAVLLFGREIAGSKSWFDFGFFRFQPAELAKVGVAMGMAKYLDHSSKKLLTAKSLFALGAIMLFPMVLVIKQGDTGSALVFMSFIFVLYREGLPHFLMIGGLWIVALFIMTLFFMDTDPLTKSMMIGDGMKNYLVWLGGILAGLAALIVWAAGRDRGKVAVLSFSVALISVAFSWGVGFFVTKILKPHQQKRIEVLINRDADPRGSGYQVTQAMIAIGSGGFSGKGFLKGTQTKFDFVPDQSTDFIFCTIGEEHGWLGSLFLIGLYVALLSRILVIAERQKSRFNRVYGYGVFSVLFFHFIVNLGMNIGLVPVIGIPLPFFSYGGSSLLSFTILLFFLLKLDAHRKHVLVRD